MAQPGRNSYVEKVRREKLGRGESQKREDASQLDSWLVTSVVSLLAS